MKATHKAAVLIGLIFGFVSFVIVVFFLPAHLALLFAIFAAAFATLVFSVILDLKARKYAQDDNAIGDKALLRESANYYNQKLHCNGLLYLTADELIFISHEKKETFEIRIPIGIIKTATYGKVFRHLVGLKIIINDGSEIGFVVRKSENYIEKITSFTDEKTPD